MKGNLSKKKAYVNTKSYIDELFSDYVIPENIVRETQLTARLALKQDTLTFDNVPTESSNNPVKSGGIKSALDEKVSKVTGKDLSSNDYTDAEKTKLSNIPENAEQNVQSDWNVTDTASDKYIHNKPENIEHTTNKTTSISSASTDTQYPSAKVVYDEMVKKVDKVDGKGLSKNDFTDDYKTKLDSVSSGAEVNVQSDWNQTDNTQDDFIKNRPDVYNKKDSDKRYLPQDTISGTAPQTKCAVEAKAVNYTVYGNSYQATRSGKNLLTYPYLSTYNNTTFTINGITFTDIGDGTVKANGTATGDAHFNITSLTLATGAYKLSSGLSNDNANTAYGVMVSSVTIGSVVTNNGTADLTVNDATDTLYPQLVVKSGQTINNIVFKPMLTLASVTDQTYEQYGVMPSSAYPSEVQSVGDLVTSGTYAGKYKIAENITNGDNTTSITVYLNEPLRKIGDYADYIDWKNQKVVRNTGYKQFDGTETWSMIAKTGYNMFYTLSLAKSSANYIPYITMSNRYTNSGNQKISLSDVLYVFSTSSSINDFKSQLVEWNTAGNPLKVYYVLATPTEESIVLAPMSLGDGTNNIVTDTTIQPSNVKVTYYQNPTDVINETYATKTELPTKTSDLTNDSGYITIEDISESSSVGKTYQVNGVNKGEIFNDYTNNKASGNYSHAEGYNTKAEGAYSHAECAGTTSSGNYSHAEGNSSAARGYASHSEGSFTLASAGCSHSEGATTMATGSCSHVEGNNTTAETYVLHTQGQYNVANTVTTSPDNKNSFQVTNNAFVIGNGTSSSAKSNAFRVDFSGNTYGLSAFNSTGADYAEYFEWSDGNPDNEDRVGYFVTFDNCGKIKKATSSDEILGIVSGTAGVIGDSYEDTWNGMYLRDNFGRFIYEDVEVTYPERKIGDKVIEEARTVTEKHIKLNPSYNSSQEYIPRSKRKEWSCVGTLGKLFVYDDGTCQVNSKCICNNNGVATASTNNSGYRVIERIADNIIRIWFK